MTPDLQRTKIAEACGWTFVCSHLRGDEPDFQERKEKATHCWVRPGNMMREWEVIPNFLSDLNAMQTAENILTPHQTWVYVRKLSCIFADHPDDGLGRAIFATAAQRAEAFLRTLNLWQEPSNQEKP